MKTHKIFITGIGTDVGKTIVSSVLTESLEADYWKPIQSGIAEGISDLETVQNLVSNSKSVFYNSVYNLAAPVSPHLAAKLENDIIKRKNLIEPNTKNHLIVEGAGGLLVPINEKKMVVDLIGKEYSVILVSKNYLGSINHTLLSVFFLKSRGFKKIGILFNGEKNQESERIIKKMGKVKIIGSINQLTELSKEQVKIEAKKIHNALLKFLMK
jgi:dethiobiotin synthetase